MRYAHERVTVLLPSFIVAEGEGRWFWKFEGHIGLSGVADSWEAAVEGAKEAALRFGIGKVVE